MDQTMVAVATITWARTPVEEGRLRRSLARLAGVGVPVAVADANTSRDFAAFLARLPGCRVTVPSSRGLTAQVAASLGLAGGFGRRFILYTEPDKELFFGRPIRDFVRCAETVYEGRELGVALAARSAESFRTYPRMQRYTEGVINRLCGDLLGCRGDYSYGPFLLNHTLLPHLRTLEQDLGWGWRHFAFRAAHRLGLPVVHVTGEHPCPSDQRTEDDAERTHRLRQLSENIRGLIAEP
jgi:hypothetical protein